jgi:hypothetical protein
MNSSLNDVMNNAMAWVDGLPEPQHHITQEQARTALADALVWVAEINAHADVSSLQGDALEKLRKWLERLLDKLREIVKDVNGASFSITSGTRLTLTVTFDVSRD